MIPTFGTSLASGSARSEAVTKLFLKLPGLPKTAGFQIQPIYILINILISANGISPFPFFPTFSNTYTSYIDIYSIHIHGT